MGIPIVYIGSNRDEVSLHRSENAQSDLQTIEMETLIKLLAIQPSARAKDG